MGIEPRKLSRHSSRALTRAVQRKAPGELAELIKKSSGSDRLSASCLMRANCIRYYRNLCLRVMAVTHVYERHHEVNEWRSQEWQWQER